MSKPVHPDSDTAKIQGLGWRTSQLERRPAPTPAAAGSGGFPTDYHPMLTGIDNTSPNALHWNNVFVYDTIRTNFAVTNGDPDSATNWSDGAYICFGPMWLGPQHSMWRINLLTSDGPDHGKFDIEVATFPSTDPIGSLSDITTLTYFTLGTADMYHGAGRRENQVRSIRFTTDGADGTAVSSVGGTGLARTTDGGAGYWAVRLIVNGQNGSSSDVRASLSDFEVKLVDSTDF